MLKPIKTFFKSEIAIGICLFLSAIAAILISNSDSYTSYKDFFASSMPLNIESLGLYKEMSLIHWINDLLMAIFFLLVGLELKREVMIGELSSKQKLALPLIAAIGGVVVPIGIFFLFNFDQPQNIRGFAVPAATDIAFAYGIISMFGKGFSNSLKVFIVALAIIDDLIAIIIIAVFYSHDLKLSFLAASLIPIAGLGLLNLFNSHKTHLYLIIGATLWVLILKSGLHPTLAGVIIALFIPLQVGNTSPLSNLAHKISPTVNFLILPIFAFANAGVRIEKLSIDIFLEPLALGIAAGLFIGKQLGVTLFGFIAVKLNLAHLPRGTTWLEFYIASILTGIGFTMSLFVGSLAFFDNLHAFDEVKIGVICGSLASIIFSGLLLFIKKKREQLYLLKNK
jgi:NhaA family Na+:H+ antiporter